MIEEKRNELIRLLNKGFEFEITEIIYERTPGLKGFFKPKGRKEVDHKFFIKEPTLSVLDRISIESLNLDESAFNNLKTDVDIKQYSRKHLRTMAKIIAISNCGPNALESEINKKTNLFHQYLKPSDIYSIIQLIDIVSNLGDFINSTRLVAAANVLKEQKADQVEEATA